MTYFAIRITEKTLPLVTLLNDGVEPSPESMNHVFMTPATKPDEATNTIITMEEFNTTQVIASTFEISIVKEK